MERKAKIKKELPGDPADLNQQSPDMKNSQPETITLQALQASETRYRRLFETAQDGILILDAETGEIVDVNPYMIEMLHYSYEEFIGMKLWEVSPFKDTVLNRSAFEELQEKGYIQYKDLPLETKEGKSIAVEFVSNVYKSNGNRVIQCNIRNITERKEANRKLQEAAIFQQRLIDALPVPVFYKDSAGKYLGCNSSFEHFFGKQREQIIGQSVHDLSSDESADIYDEKDLALLRNPGMQMYESTVRDTDGITHNVIFHKATYLNMDGSVGGLIGGILDITDRKRTEEELKRTLESLRKSVNATIQVMVSTVERRDPYTAGHQIRSANLALAIAAKMGLPQEKIDGIRMAGSIHDIGKLSIPAEILSKPNKLSEIEFSLIKEHAGQGYEILKDVESPWPLAEIVYQHHERMDGSGYPRNLKREDILVEARILAVADVVESMASFRPYRPALGIESALEEIDNNRGKLYDLDPVAACLRLFREEGFQFEAA